MLQQVDTYIAWINKHLEHHPRRRVIDDLQNDMCDGVVFLQLIEVIGRVELNIKYDEPLSLCDITSNINRVIDFLSNNNVRVHHILPKEIIEGKLKSIMRLVLLLAAHFKPNDTLNKSFPLSHRENKKLARTPSLVSMLSNAAVSLVDARGNASGSSFNCINLGRRSLGSSKSEFGETDTSSPSPKKSLSRSLFTPSAPSHCSESPKHSIDIERTSEYELTSTPMASAMNARPQRSSLRSFRGKMTPKKTIAKYFDTESPVSSQLQLSDSLDGDRVTMDQIPVCLEDAKNYNTSFLSNVVNCHDEMLVDIGVAKCVLIELQNLIVNGCREQYDEGHYVPSLDETFEEQLILRTVMLEQKEEECVQLKKELNELKEINLQWRGEKVAYQTRLSQQEQVILALKCNLLQNEILLGKKKDCHVAAAAAAASKELDELRSEIAIEKKESDKQKEEVSKLNTELEKRLVTEASLHSKLEIEESKVGNLYKQVRELSERLHSLSVTDKVCDDSYVSVLTAKMKEAKFRRDYERMLGEHETMCITLHNLRNKFKSDDPVQHAFESIEQSITTFMDTLSMLAANLQTKETNLKFSNITHPSFNPNFSQSSNSSDSGVQNSSYAAGVQKSSPANGEQLKVIYYSGKSGTPVLRFSDIGLGLFTLHDFKQVVCRPGWYRYFFKCAHSEYGFVRKELTCDNDLVPGYDNKVVAWLEKLTTPVSDV